MIRVSIGIQTRLNNTRLPEKSLLKIDNKEIIFHMIDNIYRGIEKINKHKFKNNTECLIYILVPSVEEAFWIKHLSSHKNKITKIISGDMDNVFSRYEKLLDHDPSYIMRLTADCPFIPHQLITKAVNTCVNSRLDYLSNVDENLRTMPDGFDVEMISREAFSWLKSNVYESGSKADLEHVTTFLRANRQSWMKFGILSYVFDMSDLKFSVDTPQDFETVERVYTEKVRKDILAKKKGIGVYEY